MTTSASQKSTELLALEGYTISDLVFDAGTARVFRGRRAADGAPVLLKTVGFEGAAEQSRARLEHEFAMTCRVESPHVIRAYGLEQLDQLSVLVLEDFGAESLETFRRRRRLDLAEILGIGIQVAEGLRSIHQARIIHKDINPSNIVYSAADGVAKIIDFGIATDLAVEQPTDGTRPAIEGSLPYLSPEQTGRMQRSVDYRTDFYSLGVTLYELFTGRPLFTVTDPFEWVHCHIARKPERLSSVDSTIPGALSDIVAKLLEKSADERYQSAVAIASDLRRCLAMLQERGSIERFPLGQDDVAEGFNIPQRLYGREAELASLVDALERARAGSKELVLVSGPAGIGKSRLVQELVQVVARHRGHFVSGRFDPSRRNVPYAALAGALRDLVRQLLTTSEAKLAQWRARIEDALAPNAALVTELVPELELIIGPQPAAPPLPPIEAERRFHRALENFIQVFCAPEHPLVIFLDDMEEADLPTLRLTGLLLTESQSRHLVVVGAYRANEVGPDHPVVEAISRIRGRSVPIVEVEVPPYGQEALEALLGEALGTSGPRVADLAELVHSKTGGNPFFVEDFLGDLHQEGHIAWGSGERRWTWNVDSIRAKAMTDNLVDIMTTRLRRLSPETLGLLRTAACVGTRIPLAVLADVANVPPEAVARGLREAIAEGLLTAPGETYRLLSLDRLPDVSEAPDEIAFGHDRIQQAAYTLLSEEERETEHLRIGRYLLGRDREQLLGAEQLFDLLRHLYAARERIVEAEERLDVCRLNLLAAERAKKSTNFPAALEYARRAREAAGFDLWSLDPALAVDLHVLHGELAYLCGGFDESEAAVVSALEHVHDVLGRSRLQQVRIGACLIRGEMHEAVKLAKPVLAQLGHRYPDRPSNLHFLLRLAALNRRLRKIRIADIADLPPLTDPHHRLAMEVGEQIGAAVLLVRPKWFPLMTAHGVRVTIDHGLSPTTGFASFASVLAGPLGDVGRAREFAELAKVVMARPEARGRLGRSLQVCSGVVEHWYEPIGSTLDDLRTAHRLCLQDGDYEYAVHSASVYAAAAFASGMPLDRLARELPALRTSVSSMRFAGVRYIEGVEQLVQKLRGLADRPSPLVNETRGSSGGREKPSSGAERAGGLHGRLNELTLSYLFRDLPAALEQADAMHARYRRSTGDYTQIPYLLFDALTRLGVAADLKGRPRTRLLRQVAKFERKLDRYARVNPANGLNKVSLVRAERARVAGRDLAAHELFDAAARQAREQGFTHEEGIAYELCGRMHLLAGRSTVGEPYLAQAAATYRRWGANALARALEREFAGIAAPAPLLRAGPARSNVTTGNLDNVNIGSLMKALRSIVDETVHSRMVATIINTSIEFAGAVKGILALRDSGNRLCVEAEYIAETGMPRVLQSLPIADSTEVCQAVVNYVARTRTSVVIHDAQQPTDVIPGLNLDPYVRERGIRSVLCLPIIGGLGAESELIGLIYLENNLASHCFTEDRIGTLEIIGLAAAGRLELSRKAAVDGLTELYNHEYFQTMLNQEFTVARRHGRDLSLIMADVDHFKQFNDSWGHQAGDVVLREVARLIREICRATDIPARYGGEELAVILLETGVEGAALVAERMRKAVEDTVVLHDGNALRVTMSVGFAALSEADADKASLIGRADAALYMAKRGGRNRISRG